MLVFGNLKYSAKFNSPNSGILDQTHEEFLLLLTLKVFTKCK
jgi:hypothetical protein